MSILKNRLNIPAAVTCTVHWLKRAGQVSQILVQYGCWNDLRVVSGEGRLLPNPNDTMYEYHAHLDLLLDIAYADHMLTKAVHARILAPGLIF